MRRAPQAAAAAFALAALAAPPEVPPGASARNPPPVPPIVFVSRAIPADPALVPGLGPRGRALAPGGRLMVRERSGRVRALLPDGALWDASDPSVSWDGRRIAFAATVHPDSAWRLWVVGADGRGLAPVTRTDGAAGAPARYDDLDPCWLPDGRIVFASTRFPQVAQQGGGPVTNLFTVHPDGSGLARLTSERNGAEEPTVDPATGRIVYARWFVNRWLASERTPLGVTDDRALAVRSDTVDVWHALTILPDGDEGRLAGGDARGRASVSAYQPAMLDDGTLAGLVADDLSLARDARGLGVQSFARGFAAPRLVAGRGRGGARAVAPAALPSGALVLALDARGDGDFGLWAAWPDGAGLTRLADLPGAADLDPAPLVARRRPPVAARPRREPLPERPIERASDLHAPAASFRFDCLNVFANGPVDAPFPDAVPIERGVRIRFYATLARPSAAGGDTVVLVREAPVDPSGAVHVEELPGDTPMFEQLVGADGRVLRSAMGPAHVPGLNFARVGSGTKCVGCHAGHSALPVAPNYAAGKVTNVAPSAEVTASSVAPGTDPRGAVDRRTRGPAGRTAWIAAGAVGEKLHLRWRWPIEAAAVVLYPLPRDRAAGTDVVVQACEIVFFRDGREVERTVLEKPLSPSGTRAECNGLRIDALEVRPMRVSGRVLHRAAAALAEIEAFARIVED
uniref:DUF7402 domain-containing protein n=1 Tax=Eiseniibacteriota bacterium TaxID=2212470 RepID=A0A832I3S2_UNCEI